MSDAPDHAGAGRPDQMPADPGHLCFLIAKDLRTALDRDLAGFGLTAQQAAVLTQCIRQKGAGPRRLASQVGTDSAGITGLIDHLQKKGLVTRRTNPEDRRAIAIKPTKAGAALAPRLRFVLRQFAADCLRGFSAEEVAILSELLRRLQTNAKEILVARVDARPITR